MEKETSMIIKGSTLRKCWNCDKETYGVSLTFETPMCSDKCDDVKYREYNEHVSQFVNDEI